EVEKMLHQLERSVGTLEFHAMMNEEADSNNAFVTIQAGAGGTESCDWTQILYRMYMRWAEEKHFAVEELDLGPGEQAGIRSVTFAVRGKYAYGRLRSENGVHRLVRISPFDSNARRQTSFASVDVLPEIDDDFEIEVKEGDITMETFTSGGPGGQHQNKTASGVRLRHAPSGIVVECRSERSQHKNRATCMKMIKAKMYQIEMDKRKAEVSKHYEGKSEIAFGSQIRSYVLHPYQLVKDHRTDTEIGNAGGVLEGNIDPFIESYLRSQIGARA
ncbi:MAG: peptide chain release factor 2, partial [Planctomycetia bacterium]